MQAFVTGATGFTGGHLALALRARGYGVRALVRDAHKSAELAAAGVELVEGDLVDADAVRRTVDGCDVIFHVAAVYREARHSDEYYREVNVTGTRNVLEAAERAAVKRMVHCSTVGVHGNVTAVPSNEDSPFSPGDIYQVTKLEAEMLVRERADAGFPVAIIRPTAIYGPGDRRFLKLFRTIQRGTFRIIGKGDVYYHMVYVSDLVDGMILCGEHPNAVGRTFILGGRRYYTLSEIAEIVGNVAGTAVRPRRIPVWPVRIAAVACERIWQAFGAEPPLYPRRLDFFTKNRAFSIEKARCEIGYDPKVPLHQGIQQTFDWYRSANWL